MHRDTDFTKPPRRRVGALALILDESGSVLMVEKSYNGRWGLPGGSARADEFPHVACAREVTEETGLISFTPGRLLVLDYMPRNEGTGVAEGFNFVYYGGKVPNGTKITLPSAEPGKEPELVAYRFVPLYALGELTTNQEGRIRQAYATLEDRGRHMSYLVEGRPFTAAT